MGDHLDHHPIISQLAIGVNGDQHETHVGKRGVGDQTLDIGLYERHPSTIEDAKHPSHMAIGANACEASGNSGRLKRSRL